ncbi:uncharacterized protein EDB91DRAFT_1338937 [Suillus paluster]|uniref:uncharacterized protein n=1 Tax=Suillus paluster TaxID=48578 RepID=UPI001B85F437|nr:uncharacterized protein EDB91DRAFT_1338937 [Suillus paluster]KAG1729974.1 hypothetical protein EDB91DRAFT_1338937 [Suillus paluster]
MSATLGYLQKFAWEHHAINTNVHESRRTTRTPTTLRPRCIAHPELPVFFHSDVIQNGFRRQSNVAPIIGLPQWHRDHAQQAELDWQRDTKALNTNPFDVEVQYCITKAIRQQAIMENLEHVLDYRQVFGRVTAFQTGADQRCGRKAFAHNESVPGGNATKRALWGALCYAVTSLFYCSCSTDTLCLLGLTNTIKQECATRILKYLFLSRISSHAAEEDSDVRFPYATFFMRKESLLSESGPQQVTVPIQPLFQKQTLELWNALKTDANKICFYVLDNSYLPRWNRATYVPQDMGKVTFSAAQGMCTPCFHLLDIVNNFFVSECPCLRLKIFQRSLFHSRRVVDDVMIQDEHCRHYSMVLTLDDRDLVYASS